MSAEREVRTGDKETRCLLMSQLSKGSMMQIWGRDRERV